MNILQRIRLILNVPRVRQPDPGPRTVQVPLVRAGMHVDHDVALTYSAVYSAVRVIAETIGMLPWRAMRRTPTGRREHVPTSPVEFVLSRQPNPEMSPMVFRTNLIAHALLWGNGYAEIVRDNAGRVAELWPLIPDTVEPKRDRETGEKYYRITPYRGETTELSARDVFHLQGLGFDGLAGYSVVSLMAKSIGLALAAEEFGSSLFGNGAMPNSVLKHPGKLGPEAHERLAKSVKDQYSGASNAFRTMILEEGMSWESVGIPPEDAQFLETRKMQVAEIARWFRVPPHKLADLDRATFSNIEHQSREFVVDTLMPWVVRLEQEADRKLFAPRNSGSMYTKIAVNGLMRGDSQARADFYQKMANLGAFSVNDIRELEDLDPIGPEGDKRLVQLNQTTLEKIGEEPETPDPAPPMTDNDTDEELPADGLPDSEQST